VYVVVLGLGEVGRAVVKALDREGHDIVAVDQRLEAIEQLEEEHDVATLHGFASSPKVLEQAGCRKADLVVAVTDNDEVNLVAAVAARGMGSRKSIARVQGTEYSGRREAIHHGLLGIDVVINPPILLAQEISKIAHSHGALDVIGLVGDQVELVELELHESSKRVHHTISTLSMPSDILVAAIVRDGELFVPGGSDVMMPGDHIYLVGRTGHMERAEEFFTGGHEATRVCIVGGTVMAQSLADSLGRTGIETLLFEQDKHQAELLSESLPNTTVIWGDGTDLSLLQEEQIHHFDLFCALTDHDEINLMAGLMAKRSGAKRVISVAHRPDYSHIYRNLGIDVVLSPRVVATEHILRYVHRASLQSLTILEGGQAEVLELVAQKDSRIVERPLQELEIPPGILLASIVTGAEVRIPKGPDKVKPGDTVVVMAMKDCRASVEKLFKKRSL
jgi:trk system potassium uptake protein TrkA